MLECCKGKRLFFFYFIITCIPFLRVKVTLRFIECFEGGFSADDLAIQKVTQSTMNTCLSENKLSLTQCFNKKRGFVEFIVNTVQCDRRWVKEGSKQLISVHAVFMRQFWSNMKVLCGNFQPFTPRKEVSVK